MAAAKEEEAARFQGLWSMSCLVLRQARPGSGSSLGDDQDFVLDLDLPTRPQAANS